MDHNKLWKILKEMGIPDHLTCLLRNVYAGQEATVRTGMEQTGSELGKEYVKAVYCHPANLTYMQSISCEMLDWMKHKAGVKIAGRNINNIRYADDTTLMAESKEEQKSLLMKVKQESEKGGLKLNIQKTKIMVSGPITSWQIWGKMVTAMLAAVACFFYKKNYDQPRQHIKKQRDITLLTKVHMVQAMVFPVPTWFFQSYGFFHIWM